MSSQAGSVSAGRYFIYIAITGYYHPEQITGQRIGKRQSPGVLIEQYKIVCTIIRLWRNNRFFISKQIIRK